ncbi:hypothetical protein [Dysgonomonas sp. 25]|uniref:hypothetical protein n=1 Tax=Dysgonomonas sp. 25 TaxID=2302933 RepID=UPI0013D7E7FD|nr:hypothetical protein [Dysgonomonas sp. 25]
MNLGQKKWVIAFLLGALVITSGYAQVTIGSGDTPLPGAILDLKESGTTTKGLGLPRVALSAVDKLKMGTAPEITNATEKQDHIGLVVYNIQQTGDLCKGMHVWTGDKWEALVPLKTAEKRALADPNSNAFLIKPNQSIDIPVQKAYDMWANEALLDNLTLTGPVTAEVYWSDTEDLIEVTLSGGDQGANSVITVYPKSICSYESFKSGNAVVAVRVNSVIRWSWHIWMTDYDPDGGGKTYTYNNGTYSTTFMDRNLGALSADPADGILAMGNTYQWGRKDPFPHPADVEGTGLMGAAAEIPLYGTASAIVNDPRNSGTTTHNLNLQSTITDPIAYGGGVAWFAWDSHLTYFSQDADFWGGVSGTKGAYDPCPEGWMVPHETVAGVTPWDGISISDGTYVPITGDLVNAYDFSSTIGTYPLSGGRWNMEPTFQGNQRIGEQGSYWSAKNVDMHTGMIMTIRHDPLTPMMASGQFHRKGYALSVRCVKQ